MQIKSFAKINIFLEILEKKDNFHILYSLFSKINIFDIITVKPSSKLEITYSKTLNGDIILKAVQVLQKHFPNINTNFSFFIEKNIPIGSGLGGGSSNAAEVMKFLLSQNNINIDGRYKFEIAEQIGADVPFFMMNQNNAILHGIGKELTATPFHVPQLWCVLYFPEISFSTKEIFSKVMLPFTQFNPVLTWKDALFRANDLEDPANLANNNIVNEIFKKLFHKNAIKIAMSGSGSACFALFENENDAKNCAKSVENSILTMLL